MSNNHAVARIDPTTTGTTYTSHTQSNMTPIHGRMHTQNVANKNNMAYTAVAFIVLCKHTHAFIFHHDTLLSSAEYMITHSLLPTQHT
jgi:hypothetical protein